MKIFNSICSAFAMYSRIPMFRVAWTEENRRYALCFFPLIGSCIGITLLIWHWMVSWLGIGEVLFAAGATVLPIWLTGGIHMDGYYDVIDAQSSCQTREKKLLIMSDPHIGAFSAMKGSLYFITMFALWTEIKNRDQIGMMAIGFIVSRGASGLMALLLKSAKDKSSLQDFVQPAQRKITVFVLILALVGGMGSWWMINKQIGVMLIITVSLVVCYYRCFSYKYFKGVTGDLAGYFLQICEMSILVSIVFGFKLAEVI